MDSYLIYNLTALNYNYNCIFIGFSIFYQYSKAVIYMYRYLYKFIEIYKYSNRNLLETILIIIFFRYCIMKSKSIRRRISNMSGGSGSTPPELQPPQQQYPPPETSSPDKYCKQFEEAYKEIAKKYSFTNTNKIPDIVPALNSVNMIGAVLKIEELSNHTNIFYKDNLMINNQEFPVLIRLKETSSTNWKLETTYKITLGGIYFCGDGTESEKCIMDCHLLLNLYKLNANGKELDKTDIKIRKLDGISKDTYNLTIDNLNAHIQLLKGMKLDMHGYGFTINKNRLKTFSKDTLRNVTETPRTSMHLFDRISAGTGGNKRTRRKSTHQKRNVKKNNSRLRKN